MEELSWWRFAEWLKHEDYDVEIDLGEGYCECPECREPIYKEDYPKIEYTGFGFICPVCEAEV